MKTNKHLEELVNHLIDEGTNVETVAQYNALAEEREVEKLVYEEVEDFALKTLEAANVITQAQRKEMEVVELYISFMKGRCFTHFAIKGMEDNFYSLDELKKDILSEEDETNEVLAREGGIWVSQLQVDYMWGFIDLLTHDSQTTRAEVEKIK